ncbi:hypothetical protein ACIBQ1_09750 [Nonomuraea sp. NPDC050153]|uniref:hypothetical protein n=1 Tax=Nonomuraea sp. NPDC050153 TaxID=3364359 RepID=UPI00378DB9EA
MSNPDGVLDAIDACLDDYALSEDAMRWAPDEPVPASMPVPSVEMLTAFSAFAEGLARTATALAEGIGNSLAPALKGMQTAFHKQARHGDRKHYRHCPTCNPAGFAKPLPINGHEYHRRQRRRNRR